MDDVVRGDVEGRARRTERNARAERHAAAIRAMRLLRVHEAAPTPEASASGHVTLTPAAAPLEPGRSSAAALGAVATWFAETATVPRPTGRKGMLPAMRAFGGKPFGTKAEDVRCDGVVLLARQGARVWLTRDDEGSAWRGFAGRGATGTVDAATEASLLGVAVEETTLAGTLPPDDASSGPTLALVAEVPAQGIRSDAIDHAATPRPFDAEELGALSSAVVLDRATEAALRRLGWLRDPAFVVPVRRGRDPSRAAPDPWADAPVELAGMAAATPGDDPEAVVALALAALLAGTEARLRDALATDAYRFVDGDDAIEDLAPFVAVGVGERARTTLCPTWLAAALRAVAPGDQDWDGRPLFPSPSGGPGVAMTRDEARRALDRLGRRVGARVTPSSLREAGRAARGGA